ncbi:unannotated protein [freshwater metagenome]|uniref:Unannotated protein n=1 Tax=freshwater metagenome TaxID=449393 RepID=A0A6J7NSI6_9ZZZZ
MDLGDNVVAFVSEHHTLRRPKCNMKHCSVFGDVDVFTGPHGIAQSFDVGSTRKSKKLCQCLVVKTMLGVINVEIADFNIESFTTTWIGRKKIAQVYVSDLGLV